MSERINKNFYLMNSGVSNYEDTTNLPRHRWYYYKEGFSPNLVQSAIEKSDINLNDLIIDPFNGSGTTTLTTSSLGYSSIGLEVNPFTSFLSKAKSKDINPGVFEKFKTFLHKSCEIGKESPLIGYSTFSKREGLDKWLFNDSVLNSFEGGWHKASEITDSDVRAVLKLALISSAMQNCNGRRDGKCLRYKPNWMENGFDKDTFLESFESNLKIIQEDLQNNPIKEDSLLINTDSRSFLKSDLFARKFKLCVTSPPYLNTFDYTDIYRPELFLGKFVSDSQQLYDLRLKTVRSHIQAKWDKPVYNDFGMLYTQVIQYVLERKSQLMHVNIPVMIQAYFEDIRNMLILLKAKAEPNAKIWLVVSNSAYANMEVPVDLIIGDIGSRAGWYLKEIGVLRNIKRRKTKHSPDISHLRESVIIFSNSKN